MPNKQFRNAASSRIIHRMSEQFLNATSLDAIARRLRDTRAALGLSQIQIAKRTGISATAWNNYEQAVKRISIDNGIKLCRATGVTLDWIYRGDQSGLPGRIIEKLPSSS